MADFQITIIGLGVTGTSLGLALKKAGGKVHIVGHDREQTAAAAAHKAGAVDQTDWNLPSACSKADMIILALPLAAIHDTLAVIGPDLQEGCLITDTAAVKAPVLAWAKELLPAHAHFVGGDPVGARGRSTTASAGHFDGTTYCLCPDPAAPPESVDGIRELALAVGATPYFLDAAEHDGLVAALEHLPFLLSAAALNATSSAASWRELVKLGSGRFAHLLEALGESPASELDATIANAGNVVRWIDEVQAALANLRSLLAAEPAAHEEAIKRLTEAQEGWARGSVETPAESPDVKSTMGLRRLFFGR